MVQVNLEPHLELVNIGINSSQIYDRIKMVIIKICGTNFYTNKNHSKNQKMQKISLYTLQKTKGVNQIMITFENQMRKFLQITAKVKVTSKAQSLYIQLLEFFREKFFPKQIRINNGALQNRTNLSRHQLIDARQELKDLALVDYTAGAGSQSGNYILIDLCNAKLSSIVAVSQKTDATSATLSDLKEIVNDLVDDYKIWGDYILETLNKAISNNTAGIYSNYYTTSQVFLKAKLKFKTSILYKLIYTLKNKPDIQDKQSYILASVANYVREQKQINATN